MRAQYFQVGKKWFLTIDTDDMEQAAVASSADASAAALSGDGVAAQGAEEDVSSASLGDLVFMLDLSGSMKDSTNNAGLTKIECLKHAFKTLMQHPNVQRASSIRVIGFASSVKINKRWDRAEDLSVFAERVETQLLADGGTSIGSALKALIPIIDATTASPAFDLSNTQVVIMSDGEDYEYKGREGGAKILERLQDVTPIEPIVIGIPGLNFGGLSSQLNAWMSAISPNASMIINGAELEASMPGLSALCVRIPVVLRCEGVAERAIQVRGGGYQELLDQEPTGLSCDTSKTVIECECVDMAAVAPEVKQQALLAWANDIIARAEAERLAAEADEQGLGVALTAEWEAMIKLAKNNAVDLACFNIDQDLTKTLDARRRRYDVSNGTSNSRFVSRTRTRYTQGAPSRFSSNVTAQGAPSRGQTRQMRHTGGGTGGGTGASLQPKATNRFQAPKVTKQPANPSAGAGPSGPHPTGCVTM